MAEIRVTLERSLIAKPKKLREVALSLGLRRRGITKIYKDTNCIRGAINKIKHLVSYEVIS
jgi:ribosomal protein L30